MPQRILSLDVLRGVAALAVLAWHWNWLNFDPTSGQLALPSIDQLPFSQIFWPAYKFGYLAVDLFFGISGFVFFHVYADSLTRREVTTSEFWWNRFTRLYPLHLATLLFVAGVQLLYHAKHSVFFIYPDNTLSTFGAQLFLASNWLPGSPYSFNGPIWSVSVEILLYLLFFGLARVGLARPSVAFAMVLIGSFVVADAYLLGRGFMAFFLGALCFFALKNRRNFVTLAAAMVGAGVMQMLHRGLLPRDAAIIIVGVPAAVLIAAICDRYFKRPMREVAWLGDISYSIYLLHFPVMLALVTLGIKLDMHSGAQLIAYITGVTMLSLICYYSFERPMRTRLRSLAAGPRGGLIRLLRRRKYAAPHFAEQLEPQEQ